MRKLKEWIIAQFLPVWAKEQVYAENRKLAQKIEEQQREIERMTAYAAGLEYALRRRIVIKSEVSK